MRAHRYLGWSLLIYGVGYLLAPIQPNLEVTSRTAFLWFGSAAAAFLGLKVASLAVPARASAPRFSMALASRRVTALAAIGVTCILVDRYLLRGAPLSFDFFAAREALENTPPTPLGFVGALLGSMGNFTLGLAMARSSVGERVLIREWIASTAVTLAYIGTSISLGSRFPLLVSVIVTLFCLLWTRSWAGKPLHLKYLCAAVGVLFAVALASAHMMIVRLNQMGMDPMVSVEVSGYAFTVSPSPEAHDWMSSHIDTLPMAVGAFTLLQYVYHGFFEFALFAQESAVSHTNGLATLWLPIKLLSVVLPEIGTIDYGAITGWREGIFTTFLGPLYLDFGDFLPLAAFVAFFLLGLPAAALRCGRIEWLPYCGLLCAVCVLFPAVNILDSASGAYPIVGSLLVARLGRDAASPLGGRPSEAVSRAGRCGCQ
jgi:hypothetical protein